MPSDKVIIDKMLDDWWDTNPQLFLDFWKEGVDGEEMIIKLWLSRPRFYSYLLSRRGEGAQRTFAPRPEMRRMPASARSRRGPVDIVIQ